MYTPYQKVIAHRPHLSAHLFVILALPSPLHFALSNTSDKFFANPLNFLDYKPHLLTDFVSFLYT